MNRLLLAAIVAAALLSSAVLLAGWTSDPPRVRLLSASLSAVMLVGAAYLAARRGPRSRRAIELGRVEHDADAMTYIHSDGRRDRIDWTTLGGVDIVTTSAGPWSEDVFFVLLDGDQQAVCVIPHGSVGVAGLVDRLLALPGFDEKTFIRAMGSTSEARFTCWRRVRST